MFHRSQVMNLSTTYAPDNATGSIRITDRIRAALRCPACQHGLRDVPPGLECTNVDCSNVYPLVDGIPILIDENKSVFSKEDFVQRQATFFASRSSLRKRIDNLLPRLGMNIAARQNYPIFLDAVMSASSHPTVLILGGSILGEGLAKIVGDERVEFVETDVSLGVRTQIVCDAHSLPFESNAFDGVVVQAVLEHVVDPYRCVSEIHRVLRQGGVVYAETPFMQQVHGGAFDFTRFSHSGHRRLFRDFREIASGACCGPGMALAYSLQYFFMSFVESRPARTLVTLACRLSLFWLKFFDYYLARTPGGLDGASGVFFLGESQSAPLLDRQLVLGYRGSNQR